MTCQILGLADGTEPGLPRGRRRPPRYTPTFIRAWRERSGKTLEDVAELVGTTHSTLSKIETGEQKYHQDIVERIAVAMGIHPAELLWGDPDDPASIWRIAGEAAHLSDDQRRTLLRIIEAMKTDFE